MAANTTAMKNMWKGLGFTEAAAIAIGADMGYTDLEEVREMCVQKDAAYNFCKNMRRWKDGTGACPHQITLRAEENMKKLLFYLGHMERTSRQCTPASITLTVVKSLDHQRKREDEHEEGKVVLPRVDDKDWSKTMESCLDFLNLHRGSTGVPLGYLVRETLRVEASGDDPKRGVAGSVYVTDDEEMVARAPILTAVANSSNLSDEDLEKDGPFDETFVADSCTAYNLLAGTFQDHTSNTYFKQGKKAKNVRVAFMAVWNHFLGPHMVDHLAAKWEGELTKSRYMGEGRNGNFEQYATLQKDLHQKLDGLKRHGYQGLDERTKVRNFIAGLGHASMETCKLHIQGNPKCRGSFDACVQVIRDFIQADASGEKTLNISAVKTGNVPGMSAEDRSLVRYYDFHKEWKHFDKAKQEKILRLRKEVRAAGGDAGNRPAGDGSRKQKAKVASLKKSNAKLLKRNRMLTKQAKIAAIKRKSQEEESDSSGPGSVNEEDVDEYPSTRNRAATKKSKKTRKMSAVRTIRISNTRTTHFASSLRVTGECNAELDSHADTSVVGKHALIVQNYNEPVNVVGWNPEAEAQPLETVSAALKYTHPISGQRSILVFHQAIHHPDLEHHLLCPMQMRMHGIEVNETPKFLSSNATEETFALKISEESAVDPLIIPFGLQGVTAYFPVSKPTRAEYEDESIPKIDMTDEDLPWDPNSQDFMESEAAMTDYRGQVMERDTPARGHDRLINAVQSTHREDERASNSDYQLLAALTNNIEVSAVETARNQRSTDPNDLVKRWKISPKSARKTVKHTTCRMKRTVLHPSLSRRFRTNDRALRYRRLQHDVYGDTMFSSTTSSRRGNKCAEVFGTRFGWARAYPMQSKGDAHEALSLFFQQVGVPPVMIVDNSKEQIGKKFRRKCQEAQCRLKQPEPYTPKSNAAEGTIKELKKGTRRLMITRRVPKSLWDHALELQSLIMSHTSNDIFYLQGEVPETYMTGDCRYQSD